MERRIDRLIFLLLYCFEDECLMFSYMFFGLSIRPSSLHYENIKKVKTVTYRCNFKTLSLFCVVCYDLCNHFNANVKKCNTTSL